MRTARKAQAAQFAANAIAEQLNAWKFDHGYGRPAQIVDLHLPTEAVTRRLSDMTDAELGALEARMITMPATTRQFGVGADFLAAPRPRAPKRLNLIEFTRAKILGPRSATCQ